MIYDQPDDPEGERTVILSRKDVSAARRLLQLLLGAEPNSLDYFRLEVSSPSVQDRTRSELAARAREDFHNRRRRVAIFGQSMFGEAAWDMLLALYILDVEGHRQTVGSLLRFSGNPMTTAKRWLDFLAAHDLVRRDPHPTDRRTDFVSLTTKAREKLDLYYSETIARSV